MTDRAPPSLLDRLSSAACYLGLAPLIGLSPSRRLNPFFQHHYGLAMAAFFVSLVILLAAIAFETLECLLVIQASGFVQQLVPRLRWLGVWLDRAEFLVLLAIPLVSILLGVFALAGSRFQVRLLSRIAGKRSLHRIAFSVNCLLLISIPITIVFAFWATSFTCRSVDGARVYFLYDEGIAVPRWGYAMGLYRISLQAHRNWGNGSTVLDRLNKQTLCSALASGKVVILATHGEAGYAATYFSPEVFGVWPADTGAADETGTTRFLCVGVQAPDHAWRPETVKVNDQLELVYLFACNAGKKASLWQEHLAPAKVVAYDRFSTLLDHALWFAFTGPIEVKKLR